MRLLAAYLMRGRLQAILSIATCAVLAMLMPPLSFLSGAGVALVTLRHGPRQGALVVLGAGVAVGVLAFLALGNPAPGFSFIVIMGLPLWLLALLLRRTQSLAATILATALIGIVAITLVHGIVGDPEVWWQSVLGPILKPALLKAEVVSDAAEADLWLAQMSPRLTGIFAVAVMISMLVSLFIARWWQAMLYNSGGFREEFHGLRLPRWLAFPAVLSLLFALTTTGSSAQFASEILAILLVVYLIQGLALVHCLRAQRGLHRAWLIGMYVVLIIFPQVGLGLAAVGFADIWLHFCARLGATGDKK